MHIKIQKSGTGGNTGSCSAYANYLEKENENKPEKEKAHFFSAERDKVEKFEVIQEIDNNKKKLGKDEAKFYSVTISPSEAELKHIGKDSDKLKNYTRGVMDEYAKNFNREGVTSGKDLVYFAKIEQERKYSGTDKEVRGGLTKQGELKPGDQRHIHIIVSRKNENQALRLSPLANTKNSKVMLNGKEIQKGFDRQKFYDKAEKEFDKQTNYKRSLEDTYKYKLEQAKLPTVEKLKQIGAEQEKEMEIKKEQEKTKKNELGFSFDL